MTEEQAAAFGVFNTDDGWRTLEVDGETWFTNGHFASLGEPPAVCPQAEANDVFLGDLKRNGLKVANLKIAKHAQWFTLGDEEEAPCVNSAYVVLLTWLHGPLRWGHEGEGDKALLAKRASDRKLVGCIALAK